MGIYCHNTVRNKFNYSTLCKGTSGNFLLCQMEYTAYIYFHGGYISQMFTNFVDSLKAYSQILLFASV
jgi:hypothetical protein